MSIRYEELVSRSYDSTACVAAYRALIQTPKDPALVTEAVTQSLPVLGCVLWSQFRWLRPGSEVYDELLPRVAFKFTSLLLSDRFYARFYDDPEMHFAYLFAVCRNEIIDTLTELRQQSEVVEGATHFPQFSMEGSSAAIEFRVFASQLPSYIRRTVLSKVRFTGQDREVCEAIAVSLLEGKGVPTVTIRRRWSTKNLRFFVEYARVLIRWTLLELKKDIEEMGGVYDTDLGEILRGSLLEAVLQEGVHLVSGVEEFWSGVDDANDEVHRMRYRRETGSPHRY